MKATGHIQKWGGGLLGAVVLALLVNLVLQLNRGRTGNTRPVAGTPPSRKAGTVRGAQGGAGKQKMAEELSRYDPHVKEEMLKEFEARPLPELGRNPFDFVGGPTQVAQNQTPGVPPTPPPPQTPPPPPVTLKLMGYSEGKGGVKEAMVSDEDEVYVVHEGDSVGTRYKVIKITPTVVTVQDATLHQNVDLPVPP